MVLKSIKRAWRDTLRGQLTALFVLAAGGCISLLYLYATESSTVAVEEIPYVMGAVLGAIGALLLLFFWNLVCAPYRLERDEHNETKAALKRAEENAAIYENIFEESMAAERIEFIRHIVSIHLNYSPRRFSFQQTTDLEEELKSLADTFANPDIEFATSNYCSRLSAYWVASHARESGDSDFNDHDTGQIVSHHRSVLDHSYDFLRAAISGKAKTNDLIKYLSKSKVPHKEEHTLMTKWGGEKYVSKIIKKDTPDSSQ